VRFVLDMIRMGANTRTKASRMRRPLHAACTFGQTPIVKALLEAGDSVFVYDQSGEMALHMIAKTDAVLCLETVLKHYSYELDVNVCDRHGNTMLHHAALFGRESMAYYLVELGANAQCTNQDGCTPLHYHCRSDAPSAKMVNILLDAGADPNAREDLCGYTPFHYACDRGCVEIALLLMNRGASCSATDVDDETPVDRAMARGHGHCASAVLSHHVEVMVRRGIAKRSARSSDDDRAAARKQARCERPCPVCLEGQTDIVSTECGHVLCRSCLVRPELVACPICRADVTKDAVRRIFL